MTWPSAQLSKVAELNPPFLSNGKSRDTLVSFVPMNAVSDITYQIEREEEKLLSDVNQGYTPFLNGDLLIAKITPSFENGKIAIANVKHELGFGTTEFHVIRPDFRHLYSGFLFHFLRQEKIRYLGTGRMTGSAGQKRVPVDFLSTLIIPIPPLDEQRRIAAILDTVDDLRGKRRRTLVMLDNLVTSKLSQIVSRSKKKARLSQIALIDRKMATEDEKRNLPYLGLEHIEEHTGKIVYENIPIQGLMKATNFRFSRNHVLYGKLRPYLNKVFIPEFDGVCTTEIVPILPSDKINKYYLWCYLRSPRFVNWATNKVSGAHLPRLSPKILSEVVIPVPTLSDQEDFKKIVIYVQKIENNIRKQALQLESLGVSFSNSFFG